MKNILFVMTFGVAVGLLGGCAAYQIDSAIKDYGRVKNNVSIGDSKKHALELLIPTQKDLPQKYSKGKEAFTDRDGSVVEIYYFRSLRQADGLTTDDEFTPYIFRNERLVAVGWAALGNRKTQGQAVPIQ